MIALDRASPKRLRVKLGLALVALAALVAACGGGGGGGDDELPPFPAAEDVAEGVLLTPAAAEATPGYDAVDVVPGTDGATYPAAAGELSALLNRGLASPFVVAYKTAGPDGDAGDAYALTNRPPLSRIDVTNVGDAEPSSLTAARKGGATVSCSLQDAGWECAQTEALAEQLLLTAGPVVFPRDDDFRTGAVAEVEARAVAGVQTRCFDMTDAVGTSQYCVSAEGVPLYYQSPSTTAEATAYSLDVPDTAFDLPVDD